MKHPSPLYPRAKANQSRDRWMNDAGLFSRALDEMSFVTLYGDRPQQIEVADGARELLTQKGYPVRPSQVKRFDVTIRTANGYQFWSAIGRSSIDVLLDTLTHFDEQTVTIRVRPEA